MNKVSIGIDTSGNTGKQLGTTGFTVIENINEPTLFYIKAKPNQSETEYFLSIVDYLNNLYGYFVENMQYKMTITIEKYIEYGNPATKFTTPATIKLNTEIESWIKNKNIIFRQKPASHLKHRWSDKVLIAEGYGNLEEFKKRKIKPYKDMIDSLRASLDGWYFGIKE